MPDIRHFVALTVCALIPLAAQDEVATSAAADLSIAQELNVKGIQARKRGDPLRVPEPGTLALLGLGLAAIAGSLRSRKH